MTTDSKQPLSAQFTLNGRVALVTGGARDIGRAIAVSLAHAGADVLITYMKSSDAASSTVDELRGLGVRAEAAVVDVRDPDEIEQLAQTALAFGDGRLDILVNNAGGDIRVAPLRTIDVELINATLQLNFTSALLLCKALVPVMVEQGSGRVINIGSVAAATGGGPAQHHYSAAKAALTSLARSLTNEFGKSGVTFNTIAPGFVDNTFHINTPREVVEEVTASIPLGRTGVNDDIGGAAAFLASEAAAWITGEVVNINGGMYYGR